MSYEKLIEYADEAEEWGVCGMVEKFGYTAEHAHLVKAILIERGYALERISVQYDHKFYEETAAWVVVLPDALAKEQEE